MESLGNSGKPAYIFPVTCPYCGEDFYKRFEEARQSKDLTPESEWMFEDEHLNFYESDCCHYLGFVGEKTTQLGIELLMEEINFITDEWPKTFGGGIDGIAIVDEQGFSATIHFFAEDGGKRA